MRKTLLQAILAAFCAILCATSMGGGGMRGLAHRMALTGGMSQITANYTGNISSSTNSILFSGYSFSKILSSTAKFLAYRIPQQTDMSATVSFIRNYASYSEVQYHFLEGTYDKVLKLRFTNASTGIRVQTIVDSYKSGVSSSAFPVDCDSTTGWNGNDYRLGTLQITFI